MATNFAHIVKIDFKCNLNLKGSSCGTLSVIFSVSLFILASVHNAKFQNFASSCASVFLLLLQYTAQIFTQLLKFQKEHLL